MRSGKLNKTDEKRNREIVDKTANCDAKEASRQEKRAARPRQD